VVASIGDQVGDIRVGDRVCVSPRPFGVLALLEGPSPTPYRRPTDANASARF
jgi:hypothetical protein